jgi:hypothetical protein
MSNISFQSILIWPKGSMLSASRTATTLSASVYNQRGSSFATRLRSKRSCPRGHTNLLRCADSLDPLDGLVVLAQDLVGPLQIGGGFVDNAIVAIKVGLRGRDGIGS